MKRQAMANQARLELELELPVVNREEEWRLTSWIGKHAHQRSQLGRTASVRNVQPTSSGTRHAASLRGLLLRRLLALALLLLLLLLVHDGQPSRQSVRL